MKVVFDPNAQNLETFDFRQQEGTIKSDDMIEMNMQMRNKAPPNSELSEVAV